MFNIGGINFKIGGDLDDLKKSFKDVQDKFKNLRKDTEETDKLFKSINKTTEAVSKGFTGLNQRIALIGTSFGAALASGGKFASLMGGPLLLAITGVEAALGKLIKNLGRDLIFASDMALRKGIELEEVQFGLAAAVDSYSRATGDVSLQVSELVTQTERLQRTTGVTSSEIQQAQLIMLEMSRSTGLTNDKIEELIKRAAEFSVVAKQDFLSVILAMDNAFVGLPQRLTNMGINVTEAALNMEEGSKSAAIYNKILESTEFAVGKVADSFDNTLFGALKRSQTAWDEYDRKVAEATKVLRDEMVAALANVSTELARLLTPLAGITAAFQTFGGPLLLLVGNLVQFAAVIVGLQVAFKAFRVVMAANIFPALTGFVTQIRTAVASTLDFAVSTGQLSAAIKGATVAQTAWNIAWATTREIMKVVMSTMVLLLRLFLPLAAVVGVATVAYAEYRKTIGATNEELLNAIDAQKAQVHVIESSLESYERLKDKQQKTREEKIEFNKAVKTLNDIMPGVITLLKEENKVLTDNTDILRKNLELKRQDIEIRKIALEGRLQRVNQELASLVQERDELETRIEKQRELIRQAETAQMPGDNETIRARKLMELKGLHEGLIAASEVHGQLTTKISEKIAELERLMLAVGRTTKETTSIIEFNLKAALEAINKQIQARERQLSLENQLNSVITEQIRLQQELDETPALNRELQLLAKKREEISKEHKLIQDINKLKMESLNVEIKDLERRRETATDLEVSDIDVRIKELKEERASIKNALDDGIKIFSERIATMSLQEQTIMKAFSKNIQNTLTTINNDIARAGQGMFTNAAARIKDFETETNQLLQNFKKNASELLASLPEGREKEEVSKQLQVQEETLMTERHLGLRKLRNDLFEQDLQQAAAHNQRLIEVQKQALEEEITDLNTLIEKGGNTAVIALERQNFKQLQVLSLSKKQLEEQQRTLEQTLERLKASFADSTLVDDLAEGAKSPLQDKMVEIVRGTGLSDQFNNDLRERIRELQLQLEEVKASIRSVEHEFDKVDDPVKRIFAQMAVDAKNVQESISLIGMQMENVFIRRGRARDTNSFIASLNEEANLLTLQLREANTARDELFATQRRLREDPSGSGTRIGSLDDSQRAEVEQEVRKQIAALNNMIAEMNIKLEEARQSARVAAADRVIAEKEAILQISQARGDSFKEQMRYEADLLAARADRLDLELNKEQHTVDQIKALRISQARVSKQANQGFFDDYVDGMRNFLNDMEGGFGFMRQAAIQTAMSMSSSLSTHFFDAMEGRFASFKDIARGLFDFMKKLIADITAQMVTMMVLKTAVGAAGGLGFGSVGGGTAAAGTMVGGFELRSMGGVIRKQTGGLISGKQAGLFGDKVPVLAEDQEFMMRRQAVEKFGLNNMQRINEGMMPIPLAETGMKQQQSTTIINVVDPSEVPRYLRQHPDAVTNIVSSDVARNGSIRTILKR